MVVELELVVSKMEDIQNSSSTQLRWTTDVLSKTNKINDDRYDAFALSSEITGLWLENVNVIDFSVS